MNVHFISKTNEWATPQELFDKLDNEFGFTLDPCATPQNAKCKKFYTKEDDGLAKDWSNETVFMNPPYGRQIKRWAKKAYEEWHDWCAGCVPCPGQNRYGVLARLFHESRRNQVYSRACEVR